MLKTQFTLKHVLTDIFWYMLGAVIPMLIGFLKSPIFTRYFTPEEYGYYSLAFVTFNYLSIALYYWLTSCIYRFYLNFKKEQTLDAFYSQIALLFILSTAILLLISGGIVLLTENQLLQVLFILAGFHIAFAHLNSLMLTVLKINGKAKLFNLINSVKTILAFGLLCLLTFVFEYRIEALFIHLICIELLLLIGLVLYTSNKIRLYISIKKMTFQHSKMFFTYGTASLIISFCTIFINSSDRYIIALYYDIGTVGVYNQVFNLGIISIGALATVFQNAINPSMIQQLEYNIKQYFNSAKHFMTQYLVLLLPVAVILSLYSKEFAFVLLGEEFRSGYIILPFVFFSRLFEGATVFNNAKYKFENKLTFLVTVYISISILNVILNFIFIPRLGYHYAVITTLISYILAFFIVLQKDIKHLFTIDQIKLQLPFLLMLISIICIDTVLERTFGRELSLIESIFEGIFFVMIYGFVYLKKFKLAKEQ